MRKFKIGDKVRFIEEYWGRHSLGPNDYYTIKEINTTKNILYFTDGEYDYSDCVELVETEFIIKTEADYYTWLAKR